MKATLFLIAFFFVAGNCIGQITFQRMITTDSGCVAYSVQQTNDGGYIIAGTITINNISNSDVYLIKTNNLGDILWTKTYGDIFDDEGYSVQQTNDGGYIISGIIDSVNQNSGIYIIKTTSLGDTLWTRIYSGGNIQYGYSVQQTKEGGYIIAGSISGFGAGGDDVYLLKIKSDGTIEWTKTYGGPNDEGGNYVKQTSDSGYIICGYSENIGNSTENVYLIRTNTSGDTLWTKTYGGTNFNDGLAVQIANDGGYIIAGLTTSFGAGNSDVYLIKTNAMGDTLWTRTYGGANDDFANDIQQTSDSGYIITGETNNEQDGSNAVYLIKTNATGDTIWTKSFGQATINFGSSVRQTNDGGYIIAGTAYGFDPNQYDGSIFLIKTDAKGNTGCYQGMTNTIVGATATVVGNISAIVGSGGTTNFTNTIIGSSGNDSTLCLSVGIQELNTDNSISLYPNPAKNQFTVYGLQFTHHCNITIYNMLGEVVSHQYPIINNQYSINVSSLSSGVYLLRIFDEKESWSGKFVKE